MNRNLNLRRKILCIGILFTGFTIFAQTPYNVVMNIYGDPKTQMAFNWFTTSNTTGQVQIVQGKVNNHNAFNPPNTPLKTVNATTNQNVHKAVVSGLSPGTDYSFRVGNATAWSDSIGTFTTAKTTKDPYSFIYVTDNSAWLNGATIYNLLKTNANEVFAKFPDTKFWLYCGDLVDKPHIPVQWDSVFSAQQHRFYHYPFAPAQGNHEWPEPPNFRFQRHFNLNSPQFDSQQSSTYTFIYGDAQFFAINSERWSDYGVIPYPTILDTAYINKLHNWMRDSIAAHPDIKWRIVYFHKSAYSTHGNTNDRIQWTQAIAPLFDELNIDIAFFGHDHVYQVIGPVCNEQLVQCSVSDVQQATSNNNFVNVTGKSGGIFDVSRGTLYFSNSHFGDNPPNAPSSHSNLFTGMLGKSVNSTYSNASVSTDSIVIATYAITGNTSAPLDKIKVVKDDGLIITAASEIWDTDQIISKNIVVPSGVTLTITATAYFSSHTIKVKCGGHLIVSGGTIDEGNVLVQSGGKLTISDNGKILLGSYDNFKIELGAEFKQISGKVSLK